MALPYPTKVVLPFDIATAQDMNERHANDVALADGSGLDDGAVTPSKIAPSVFNFISTSPSAQHDITSGSMTDTGISTSVPIPAGATKAIVQISAGGYYQVNNSSNTYWRMVFGSVNGSEFRSVAQSAADASILSYTDMFTLSGGGTQTLKLQAYRQTGTGYLRLPASTTVTLLIIFI